MDNPRPTSHPISHPQRASSPLPLEQKAALDRFAYLLLYYGRWREASLILESLLMLFPGDAMTAQRLAYVSLAQGEFGRSLALTEVCLAAARRTPHSPSSLLLLRSRALLGLGRGEEARESFRRFLEFRKQEEEAP
ncbi:MAG: hypothetical protein PHO89_04800 [Methylacidiphilaceae bacterium]|nr:hypothetical protein [Candidatus Methylacidiphilaceae bacterium]